MPDDQELNVDPQTAQIPVTGVCGHVYPVPLARLDDGAEFICPECGQADRFDEESLRTAKEDIAEFQRKHPLDRMGSAIGAFLTRSKKPKA